jgi:hypothetical protein
MALSLHILIALSSLVSTAYAFFSPSSAKLQASYALVAATFISGTYLVLTMHVNMLSTCATGLAYLALIAFGIVSTRSKLAFVAVRTRK